jgi:hypothetical protein
MRIMNDLQVAIMRVAGAGGTPACHCLVSVRMLFILSRAAPQRFPFRGVRICSLTGQEE